MTSFISLNENNQSFSSENNFDEENSLSNNDSFNKKHQFALQSDQKSNLIDENLYSSSIEKDESIDEFNRFSINYFDKNQRKIDHRRNKSEPLIISNPNLNQLSFESSSTSTTSNESNKQNKSLSTTTKKKKVWYNPFQSTYRQRHEEFKKIFENLPNDERLIVDYSCAWQKEILIQGRMFISQNYLCFHANFLKWETNLVLKFSEIQLIRREKTAKFIPNAIEIKTNKNDKYFFASFATRDKSYARIFQVWQTIVNNQPLNSEQMLNIIHQTYGNEIDLTSDEEENCQNKTTNSIESKSSGKEDIEDHSSVSSQIDEEYFQQQRNQSNSFFQKQIHLTQMNYLTKCPCEKHLSTQLIDRTFSISVEDLFSCIFNNDQFLTAYHQSRRIKNYQANQWNINEQTGKKERLCTYNVNVTAVFGETTISSNEKQVIDIELSNSHYIIDTEVRNEGIKYADNFFVASRYCLYQIGPNKSHLKVTCEVRYIKSVMMIIKSFIEKNAMAALQDSFTDLNNRLESWSLSHTQTEVKPVETSSNNEDKTTNNKHENEKVQKKKSIKKQQSIQTNHQTTKTQNTIENRQHPKQTSTDSFYKIFIPSCLFIMLILICVNIFLFTKLNSIDQMTDELLHRYPSWLSNYKSSNDENQWTNLLKRQEEFYQQKLISLQQLLISTENALKNVTDSLQHLTKVTYQSNVNSV